ncbi:MAG: 4Fe-4S binding protein [Magnetococcales bacterium]|nr:4Fe-4S binding protein [Magnetococcales bacterium]
MEQHVQKQPDSPVPFFLWRHLNTVRRLVLLLVFCLLILLPYISLYQNFVAGHAYDLLTPHERRIYDVMEWLTAPIARSDPANNLNMIKGNTWSGTLFGLKLSDPLAVVGQVAAQFKLYWPFLLTALLPVGLTLLLGRFYCGWICPATLLYEINDAVRHRLVRLGILAQGRRMDLRLKYGVLAVGVGLSTALGTVVFSAIYPPLIVGREIQYWVTANGVGAGTTFFLLTLLFDLLVARRGFCRYLCPGGALYALLGRYRLVRIQRLVNRCNDCTLCDKVCPFALRPMRDAFGQECNNCTACMAVCPPRALTFRLRIQDQPDQGPGHQGPAHRRAAVRVTAKGEVA